MLLINIFIDGGSIVKGDDDSFSEGIEDIELGVIVGVNIIRDFRLFFTDSRYDLIKDN